MSSAAVRGPPTCTGTAAAGLPPPVRPGSRQGEPQLLGYGLLAALLGTLLAVRRDGT